MRLANGAVLQTPLSWDVKWARSQCLDVQRQKALSCSLSMLRLVTPQAPQEVNQESPGVLETESRDWSSLHSSPESKQSQFSHVFLVVPARVAPVCSQGL